jgi:CrcB protein
MSVLYVFVGGGIGSLLRYAFSIGFTFKSSEFPWSTFFANIFACVVIGFVSHLYVRGDLNTSTRLLLATGFCGGLSTFSTFSLETLQLLQKGNLLLASVYVFISVTMCLLAVAIPVLLNNKF